MTLKLRFPVVSLTDVREVSALVRGHGRLMDEERMRKFPEQEMNIVLESKKIICCTMVSMKGLFQKQTGSWHIRKE